MGPFGRLTSELRQNWLSVAYVIALALLALVLIATEPVQNDSLLCAKDELAIAVCLRNWANAAGNLLTGFVALAAAIFAFGQWQEARKARRTGAALPAQEKQLNQAAELHTL